MIILKNRRFNMNVENKFGKLFWIAFGINALFYALNIFFLLNNEIVINNGWQHYSTLQTCLFNFALALFFVSFWLFAKIKSDKRYSKFNLYLLSLVIGFVALMQVLILDILFYTLNFLSSRKLVVNGNGDNNISTF